MKEGANAIVAAAHLYFKRVESSSSVAILAQHSYAAGMSTLTSELRHGPYVTPVIVRGVRVQCAVAGIVMIAELSNAPIPWPISEHGELIVYNGLAKALTQESLDAIQGRAVLEPMAD